MDATFLSGVAPEPSFEILEPRLMLSTVDFETPGDEGLFVNMYNSPTVSRVFDGQQHVLDVFRNNNVGSVKYSPGGDYMLGDGTVGADVHLRYYRDATYGDTGSSQSLVLKEWTDGLGQHGGYVVTLQPMAGQVKLWIGASRTPGAGTNNWDFYRGGSGHTDFFSTVVTGYTPAPSQGTHDLGWWRVDARLDTVNGGEDVQIDVTVVQPGPVVHEYTWTESDVQAVTAEGQVGLSVLGLWNVHGQFDNFDAAPEASLPPTVSLSATDLNAAEAGPDGGAFTISRGDRTDGDLTVYYSVSGTASAGDYSETLSGSATIPDGASSATLTITPVDDDEVEPVETVTLTLAEDAAYAIGSAGADTVTIASDDRPEVTLTVEDAGAAEAGADTGSFTITRS
ncbi:MAG: hypothetical protein ACYS5V_16150, partial [Planctomycetota bacterium]